MRLSLSGMLRFIGAVAFASATVATAGAADPMPSWADNELKAEIVDFVAAVTQEGGPDFVPVSDRIATFDNDGTLWSEQPFYFQLAFALDAARAKAAADPELAAREPYKTLLAAGPEALQLLDEKAVFEILALTHGDMSVEAFHDSVRRWIDESRHPRFDRSYTELTFQPMLELLAYLRLNGFRTYIVSGGGVEFMRPWAPEAYGIPREQIIGSSVKSVYRLEGETPSIVKLGEVEFVNDGPGKPVAINKVIGARPIFAAGNSDGDLEMLQWATLGPGRRLGLIVHHTDGEREWAYDRESAVGRLDKALDEAPARGWLVVDMKRDWKSVYQFELRNE